MTSPALTGPNDPYSQVRLQGVLSTPTPSRRPILIGFLAFVALLVAVGAFVPSLASRRTEEKRRRLVGLDKVPMPKLTSNPVWSTSWKTSSSPPQGRSVTVHIYLKLGVRTGRSDLLQGNFATYSITRGGTTTHLAFDPKNAGQLRLAAALAVSKDASNGYAFRLEAFLAHHGSALSLRQLMLDSEKRAGPRKLAEAKTRLIAELADGSATAYGPGTVIYEVEGRFYREPKVAPTKVVTPFSGTTIGYEIMEAMSDEKVPLP